MNSQIGASEKRATIKEGKNNQQSKLEQKELIVKIFQGFVNEKPVTIQDKKITTQHEKSPYYKLIASLGTNNPHETTVKCLKGSLCFNSNFKILLDSPKYDVLKFELVKEPSTLNHKLVLATGHMPLPPWTSEDELKYPVSLFGLKNDVRNGLCNRLKGSVEVSLKLHKLDQKELIVNIFQCFVNEKPVTIQDKKITTQHEKSPYYKLIASLGTNSPHETKTVKCLKGSLCFNSNFKILLDSPKYDVLKFELVKEPSTLNHKLVLATGHMTLPPWTSEDELKYPVSLFGLKNDVKNGLCNRLKGSVEVSLQLYKYVR